MTFLFISISTFLLKFKISFRPTGLLDPLVEVRSTKGQIDDLIEEIEKRISNNERVLITTLTIRMAEELTNYLKNVDIKVAYLHNETLKKK